MPSMMKQKFKNTIRLKMIVPAIIFGLLGVVSVATAQKTTPTSTVPKKPVDVMLNKRNANEVVQRALAEWGRAMLDSSPSAPDHAKLNNRYTFLYTLTYMLEVQEKLNVSNCIEEAGKVIWKEKLITDETAYYEAIAEVKSLLLKSNNLHYKE
jgi:hypothetical protein